MWGVCDIIKGLIHIQINTQAHTKTAQQTYRQTNTYPVLLIGAASRHGRVIPTLIISEREKFNKLIASSNISSNNM